MKKCTAVFLLCLNIMFSQNSCFDIMFEGYNIRSVTDDHEFIWVGTLNNGLIAYNKDTNEITEYNTSNSAISGNSIQSVLKSNNRLYVSSENSLMAFSNNVFQEISTTIQGIMTVAPNGNLAVAAPYEFNIIDLDNEITFTQDLLTILPNICCGKTTDMKYDANGKLWLTNYGFYEYHILSYDGLTWDVYNVNNSILPIESFYDYNALTVYSNTVLVTNNGFNMHKYENTAWSVEHSADAPSIFNEQDNIENLVINAIEYDLEGDLWIGAGEYENSNSGKIAFKYEDEWNFVYDESSQLPGVNRFMESQYESNIMYAATNDGLLIMNKNCLRLSTVDIDNISNELLVYPNPTHHFLNLSFNNHTLFAYKILNNLGQVILNQSDSSEKIIDVSKLDSGHYILQVFYGDVVITKKILKL